jgi:hypothetical protein
MRKGNESNDRRRGRIEEKKEKRNREGVVEITKRINGNVGENDRLVVAL